MIAKAVEHPQGAGALTQLWPIRALAIVAVLFLALPVAALFLRIPWAQLGTVLADPAALQAFGLSLGTAVTATFVCVLLGTSIALWLGGRRTVGPVLVRVAVLIPLVMPPLVGGVALLAVFGQHGLLGSWLLTLGIRVPFTTPAVVLAQVFVALPFMVIAVEAAIATRGRDYERVASTLGASPFMVLRRITLPLLAPAILAGALLSFARALGEYGATSLFAGSAAGVTRTVPQAIVAALQGASVSIDAGYAMAGMLVLIAALVVLAAGLWRSPLREDGAP